MKTSNRQFQHILPSVLLCALVLACPLAAQSAKERGKAQMPFESGEELVFEGEYTRFLIRGANIAELRMSATYEQPQGSTSYVWSFTGDAASKGLLSKLFGVRFHFFVQSLVEPGSFSVVHTSKLDDQSGQILKRDR